MNNSFLKQFYTIEKGAYIVDISLRNYNSIFNTWDSSVYNIRDLDFNLKEFLEECAYDITSKNKIILRFNIKDQLRDKEMEELVCECIENYFQYCIYKVQLVIKQRIKTSLVYSLVSIMFLIITILPIDRFSESVTYNLIIQSFTIGGWIFLWEALSILFIQSSKFKNEKNIYKRLLKSKITFRYPNNS